METEILKFFDANQGPVDTDFLVCSSSNAAATGDATHTDACENSDKNKSSKSLEAQQLPTGMIIYIQMSRQISTFFKLFFPLDKSEICKCFKNYGKLLDELEKKTSIGWLLFCIGIF